MGRYTRGPVILDIETALFCPQAKDHIYHERAILPHCQLMTWTLNKLKDRVSKGKLFKAEYTGEVNHAG